MPCPDENRFVALTQGTLNAAEVDALEQHFDTCDACMTLVVELAQALQSSTPEPALLLLAHNDPAPQRYTVREPVGEGGMGIVYRARDNRLDRDVKPDNIVVGHDGRVRVTDFGFARVSHHTLTPLCDTYDHGPSCRDLGTLHASTARPRRRPAFLSARLRLR